MSTKPKQDESTVGAEVAGIAIDVATDSVDLDTISSAIDIVGEVFSSFDF